MESRLLHRYNNYTAFLLSNYDECTIIVTFYKSSQVEVTIYFRLLPKLKVLPK